MSIIGYSLSRIPRAGAIASQAGVHHSRGAIVAPVLHWSGARISEVLALTPAAIDIEGGVANIETLKRRKRGIVRQVPLPTNFFV